MKTITENDAVFILRGEDEEMYLIDDVKVIEKLEAKVKELDGAPEKEIARHLLKIVNPGKYGR